MSDKKYIEDKTTKISEQIEALIDVKVREILNKAFGQAYDPENTERLKKEYSDLIKTIRESLALTLQNLTVTSQTEVIKLIGEVAGSKRKLKVSDN